MTCTYKFRPRYAAAVLLALSTITLAVMVPGGPVEMRSFANYPTWVLALFNTFLTILGLGSLVLVRYVWRGKRLAAVLSLVCGLSYLAVYLLDLGNIFPVATEGLPPLLRILEIAGAIEAVPLIVLSALSLKDTSVVQESTSTSRRFSASVIVPLVITGICIVVVATINAALKH